MKEEDIQAKLKELDAQIQARANQLVRDDPVAQNFIGQKAAYQSMAEEPGKQEKK